MNAKHQHEYTRSKPGASVETCRCGKFRHTENAGPAIVGRPVTPQVEALPGMTPLGIKPTDASSKLLEVAGTIIGVRYALDHAPLLSGTVGLDRSDVHELESCLEDALKALDRAENQVRRMTRSTLPLNGGR